MYHDVVPEGREDASGFPGGDAARYKLTPERFADHLGAIMARSPLPPLLTFDDGGASAMAAADVVESHGWRGYFFITTAYIGRPGFLDVSQLRELRARGHIVGSHSHSHPLRMAACPVPRLREEWTQSAAILSDVLGEPIETASVPGGHHSDAVCRTAAEAGFATLFTSQPTRRVRQFDNLRVVGRYALYRDTGPDAAARLAAGDRLAALQRMAGWTAKEVCKKVGGRAYLRLRARLLGASPDMRWGDSAS
jgi:peptidoglycan/xylan/chitin deacetylase (PgdA/CDA1 family)